MMAAVLPALDADLEQAVSYARAEKASVRLGAPIIATSLCSRPGAPRRGSLRCPLSLKRWQRSWLLKLIGAFGRLRLPDEPPATGTPISFVATNLRPIPKP